MIYALDGRAPQVAGDVYIAPGASVIGDVHIAAGASIWFGAILRGDVDRLTIGQGTNIQDNSVLHADPGTPLVVGAGVTVGHAVTLHGCHVGDESLIGIRAKIVGESGVVTAVVDGAL